MINWKKSVIVLTLSTSLVFSGCGRNPVTKRDELQFVSRSQEVRMGQENYLAMQQARGGSLVSEPDITEYVKKVGYALARVSDRHDLPFDFVVLNDSTPNAWCLPGGKIAINRGLLVELESEAELAAVLSHEIVHAAARHSAKNMEQGILLQAGVVGLGVVLKDHKQEELLVGGSLVAAQLLTMKYSRDCEFEADEFGIAYMVRAGYNPRAAVTLQEKFLRLSKGSNEGWLAGLFATHPPSQERVDANRETAAKYPSEGKVNEDEYQRVIEPLKRHQQAYTRLDAGYDALSKDELDRALRLAEEGSRLNPKEAHFYGLMGKIKMRYNDDKGALAAFNKAIELNPRYFDFYLCRATLLHKAGKKLDAKSDIKASNKLLPTAKAQHLLGLMDLVEETTPASSTPVQEAVVEESELSPQAAISLAQFELPRDPYKYIHLSASLDKRGFLTFFVTNNSPITVEELAIVVNVKDEKGVIQDEKFFRITRSIDTGKSSSVHTGLGPYSKEENLSGRVVAQIANASVLKKGIPKTE